ncbi:MAG: tripartite tricarboxylate transporter substrate binding protein [Rhodoplanes sp.]|uniref:Bug family tripartite tricarboxylate transporter substrate binding protein n=1 Tax=Rhodoplanes sp. TaxID=1968906 RepID=UPI0017B7CD8C|nr:tripartite tricarboxylate transporter substrate binding protein [Rhodoplanes sp.]NVO14310.1 tripartite tricarboxylate transporter substrate binding protein [Rhodoplanes sp.]
MRQIFGRGAGLGRGLGSALALACTLSIAPAAAQTWPSRPIELVVPWTAGGGVDIVARAMAQAMSGQLGQNVFVTNREGAGGTLGFRQLLAATPDGHMLAAGPATPVTNAPYLVKGVAYNADSFEYICQYFENVFAVVVRADSKYATAKDFVAAAQASPTELTYGSPGVGSIGHLSAENMADALKLKVQHIPFRGDAAGLPVLLKSDIDFLVPALSSVRGQTVRVLMVFSERRHPSLPDVPTAKELGVERSLSQGLNGLFAPKGIPASVKASLERACATAITSESVVNALTNTGQTAEYLDSEQFRARIVADYKLKGELIQRLGLKGE